MAHLQQQVAEATRRLVEADAASREEALKIQKDLYEQLALVEAERRQIASQRRFESAIGPILRSLGAATAAILAIGFSWYLLFGLRHHDDVE